MIRIRSILLAIVALAAFALGTIGPAGQVQRSAALSAGTLSVLMGSVPSYVPRINGVLPNNYVNFATNYSLTNGVAGTALGAVTITRSTVGWQRDTSGSLFSFAAGTVRATNACAKIEENRTNLLLQSQDFTTTWAALGGGTATADTQVAPDNATTGDTITATGATSGRTQSITISSGAGTLTALSIYAKPGNVDWVRLRVSDGTTTLTANFNAATGAVGTLTSASGNFTAFTSAFTPYVGANGWYRAGVIITSGGFTALSVSALPAATASSNSANGNTINVWQAQAEAAGSVSSILPTTTGTFQRTADQIAFRSTTPLGEALTIYASGRPDAPDAYPTASQTIAQVDDGTANNRYFVLRNPTTALARSGGTSATTPITTISGALWSQQSLGKVAIANSNVGGTADRAIAFNSAVVQNNTAYTTPTGPISSYRIGINSANATSYNGDVCEVAIWNNLRAPNSEISRITGMFGIMVFAALPPRRRRLGADNDNGLELRDVA